MCVTTSYEGNKKKKHEPPFENTNTLQNVLFIKGLRSDIYVIKTKMYRYDGEFSSQTRFLKNR